MTKEETTIDIKAKKPLHWSYWYMIWVDKDIDGNSYWAIGSVLGSVTVWDSAPVDLSRTYAAGLMFLCELADEINSAKTDEEIDKIIDDFFIHEDWKHYFESLLSHYNYQKRIQDEIIKQRKSKRNAIIVPGRNSPPVMPGAI